MREKACGRARPQINLEVQVGARSPGMSGTGITGGKERHIHWGFLKRLKSVGRVNGSNKVRHPGIGNWESGKPSTPRGGGVGGRRWRYENLVVCRSPGEGWPPVEC